MNVKYRIAKLERKALVDSTFNDERLNKMSLAEAMKYSYTGDPGKYSVEEWEEWYCLRFGDIYNGVDLE